MSETDRCVEGNIIPLFADQLRWETNPAYQERADAVEVREQERQAQWNKESEEWWARFEQQMRARFEQERQAQWDHTNNTSSCRARSTQRSSATGA